MSGIYPPQTSGTVDLSGLVPKERTVNEKPLDTDIVLDLADFPNVQKSIADLDLADFPNVQKSISDIEKQIADIPTEPAVNHFEVLTEESITIRNLEPRYSKLYELPLNTNGLLVSDGSFNHTRVSVSFVVDQSTDTYGFEYKIPKDHSVRLVVPRFARAIKVTNQEGSSSTANLYVRQITTLDGWWV